MGDSDGGFLHSGPAAEAEKQRGEEGAPARDPHGCPGRFDQCATHVADAFAGAAGVVLARALSISWAQPSPTGQMPGGWKAAHVRSDLADQDPGRQTGNAGNLAGNLA